MLATYILYDGAGIMQTLSHCIRISVVMVGFQDAAENHFAFPRWLNGGAR